MPEPDPAQGAELVGGSQAILQLNSAQTGYQAALGAVGKGNLPSLANFLKGAYNNAGFTQSFGNPVVPQNNPNAGFYAP